MIMRITLFVALSWAIRTVTASFSVYQYYDPAALEDLYTLSTECMAAVNTTLNCDLPTANLAAQGVDNAYWYQENITALCTAQCTASMATWLSAVETECGSEGMTFGDNVVDPRFVPYVYIENYDLACLQDSADNWCYLESETWQGSDFITWESDVCYSANPPVECQDPTWTPANISTSMSSVLNLYNSSLYCSQCFLLLWKQRLLSPHLAVSEFTDYLITQFEDFQSNCSTTMPYTTSAATLYLTVGGATGTASIATTTTASSAASITCAGQIIPVSSPPLGCNQLSSMYNVATGDLRAATNDFTCLITAPICVPLPCEIGAISLGSHCSDIAIKLNTSITGFLSWNMKIQGSCDNLAMQKICVSPPGGIYVPTGTIFAPTSVGEYYSTATPAEPTQSGSIANCGLYYNVVVGDTCNQIALVYGVTFAQLQLWNTYLNADCTNLWIGYALCVAEMTVPALSTDGYCGPSHNYTTCTGTDFGTCCSIYGACGSTQAYCGGGNCATGACNDTATGVSTDGTCGPSSSCTGSAFGDCCSIYGYCGSTSDFCGAGNCYSGNCATDIGGLSTTGECGPLFAGNKTCTGTQFGVCCSVNGYCGNSTDYCGAGNCYDGACGSVSTSTTSVILITSTSTITPSGPTQTGIIASCNAYHLVVSGDSCSSIETAYSISFATFFSWNPAIGSNCEDLELGEAYCVGISSSSTTSTSTPTSTSSTSTKASPTPPGPTQTGITSACTEYYLTISGDSCAAIETKFGITFAEFYAWNPAIGSDCTSLWASEAYCVSIS